MLFVLLSCRTGVGIGVRASVSLSADPSHHPFEDFQSRLLAHSDDWPQGFDHAMLWRNQYFLHNTSQQDTLAGVQAERKLVTHGLNTQKATTINVLVYFH